VQLVKTPSLLKFLFPKIRWSYPAVENCLYLTFDDGPHPEITDFVLDELKKYEAKATFFCIGRNVEKHPELYRRILEEGHRVGNHTFDHLNGYKTNNPDYFENIALCEQRVHSNLFRPPYGKLRYSQYLHLRKKYQVVLWDVLTYDFDAGTGKEKCLANVLDHAGKGSVVLFHDSEKAKENLYFTLPKVLKHYSIQGMRFSAIS
jgi:peptidoglycan/xylan/chitin deacetylase (PgdA/CDA1 family)